MNFVSTTFQRTHYSEKIFFSNSNNSNSDVNIHKTEGTTGIIDGLYQAAINQKQKIQNYHTQSRTDDTNKQSADLKPTSLLYAVFTTPQNAIPGSAVCAFQIDDIIDTFEG